MKNEKPVDTFALLSDLDGGLFRDKITSALKEAAVASVNTLAKSTVTIELTVMPISNSRQAHVQHSLKQKVPTKHGYYTDFDSKKTLVHVHGKGDVSIFSEDQIPFNFAQQTDSSIEE